MRHLKNSIASINNDYLEDIELCTLLTAVVENLGNDLNSGDQPVRLSSDKAFQHFDGLSGWKECFNVDLGKQKFVFRRVETYLNTLQTKTESHLEDLGIISLQNREKEVLIVSVLDLIFVFTL